MMGMDFFFFCTHTQSSLIVSGLFPITAITAFTFALIIWLTYAASHVTSDPKLSLWSKTEFVQLIVSVAFMFLMLSIVNSFCSFTTSDVAAITSGTPPSGYEYPIYAGALQYLNLSAYYAKTAMVSARYYLGAINLQEMYSTWECSIPGGLCFLSVGGTGLSSSPEAGASYLTSGFQLLMNSSMMSFFSSLMHMFFLAYVGSGLFLFLLPIAIVSRSLPYMRTFGSLIFAVIFAFYVVYPAILAAYYVVLSDQLLANLPAMMDESKLEEQGSASGFVSGSYSLSTKASAADISTVADVSAKAFFYGTFLPTLALIAASGAAVYVGKIMGEEIDLSRLMQMV